MKTTHNSTKVVQLMIVMLGLVAGLVLGFGLVPLARAQTDIYVSPDGSDVNCDGTVDAPDPGVPGQSCAVQTIQRGIDLVNPDGTVYVATGDYAEDLIIDKSLTLSGAGQYSTTIYPATSVPTCTTSSSLCNYNATNMCLIQAEDVTIHDLTLDGDNPSLTSGVIVNGADVDARNGIIGDRSTLAPNNMTVYSATVQNVYLRGIYAGASIYSTGNPPISGVDFHNNVVSNVAGEWGNSSALMFWGTAGSMENNAVEDTIRGLTCWSDSTCLIQGNVMTDAGQIGISVAYNLASTGGTTVTNNTVTAGQMGIECHHHNYPLTLADNTVDGASVGIAVGGRCANPLIESNQIDGSGVADATGIVLETDGHGYTDQDTSGTLRDNEIRHTDYGVALRSGTGLNVTAILEGNLISDTLSSSVVITGPGSLDVTLGNSIAVANTFRDNSSYLVQLINAVDDIPAHFNDWGITNLDDIEAAIYHQPDNATLGEVLYYGLTADAAPTTVVADGVDFATITAILTGLYAPQDNTVAFATSLGTVSPATDTTSLDTATTSITSTTSGSAIVTASVGYRDAMTAVTFVHPPPDHFTFAPIGDQVAGTDFTVTITAEDSSNQVLTGYDSYALLSDVTGTVMPNTTGSFSSGVWTGPIHITQAYTGNVLTATYPFNAEITGTSNAFTVLTAAHYTYLPLITKDATSAP